MLAVLQLMIAVALVLGTLTASVAQTAQQKAAFAACQKTAQASCGNQVDRQKETCMRSALRACMSSKK